MTINLCYKQWSIMLQKEKITLKKGRKKKQEKCVFFEKHLFHFSKKWNKNITRITQKMEKRSINILVTQNIFHRKIITNYNKIEKENKLNKNE